MWKIIVFELLPIFNMVVSTNLNVCDESNKCVENYKCPFDNNDKKVCYYKNGEEYVCCPSSGLVAFEKCEEFSEIQQNYEIKDFSYHIPQYFHYPFLVNLGYGLQSNIKWMCSGSLISNKFVLTAAHCVNLPNYGRVKYARMGTENFDISFDEKYHEKYPRNESRQDFYIKYIIAHPDFNPVSRQNDIALLKLSKKIKYSSYTQLACLDFSTEWLSLTTVGWGLQNNHKIKLFRFYHNFDSEKECIHYYKQLERNIDVKSQICLKDYEDNDDTFYREMDVKPFCQKYAGSPVIGYNLKLRMYLISGIASFGDDCNLNSSMPGIYTRVSYYIDWIEKIVWK